VGVYFRQKFVDVGLEIKVVVFNVVTLGIYLNCIPKVQEAFSEGFIMLRLCVKL